MKKFLSFFLVSCAVIGCEKEEPSFDEVLPPGTYNLSTVITDVNGNSTDLAGDWAVFQDPQETSFTRYIHYDQTSTTIYHIMENDVFRLEYEHERETLPVYEHGQVDKRKEQFVGGTSDPLIYLDGRLYSDHRNFYHLYHSYYSLMTQYVILDENTLGVETSPGYRLRRITAFAGE